MKLARVLIDGQASAGVIEGDVVRLFALGNVDIVSLLARATIDPTTVPPFVAEVPLASARLLAPVPTPSKLLCVGVNYGEHAKEGGRTPATVPDVFVKTSNVVIGPDDNIWLPPPSVTDQVDYEAELAVVIGSVAKAVTPDQALNVVAGYTAFNDVTGRDYQKAVSQWVVGKSFDTFGPMGPWIVTRDEIPDPNNLALSCRVNGNVLQEDTTASMIHDVRRLVSYLSSVMTLVPGDIIATGTPSGVGFFRDPPVLLRPGDVVEVDIQGIGVLRNGVVDAHGRGRE